ncbi:MAG: SRPBCC domain-containing protein [Rhodospirillales bacterium]|nr:SRPBCC domain-containing protein [Rhodospirillales bacterium]
MHFEGNFAVPGSSESAFERFADVERMARSMPGAVLDPRAADGSYPGKMVVSFGPKRISFRGKVTHEIDPASLSGRLVGRGTADLRSARIAVTIRYSLRPDPHAPAPTTIVSLIADAELGGVLADLAQTGGLAVANALMAEFSKRLGEEFSAPPAVPPRPVPLAAHRLFWEIIKAWLRRLAQRLRLPGVRVSSRRKPPREKS